MVLKGSGRGLTNAQTHINFIQEFIKYERYDGKPFLKLFECYVLDIIGRLDAAQNTALIALEEKLSKVYDTNGSWQQIVAAQLDLNDSFSEQVVKIWENANKHAQALNQTVDPHGFVIRFIDENFPTLK